MNEIKRLQKLAGINEIRVNQPNKYITYSDELGPDPYLRPYITLNNKKLYGHFDAEDGKDGSQVTWQQDENMEDWDKLVKYFGPIAYKSPAGRFTNYEVLIINSEDLNIK